MPRYKSSLIGQKVPDLIGWTGKINYEYQSLRDLQGRIIVLEFWTFGCWNCVNTIPHVKKLYDEFKSRGVEFIGIHTPEFEFEKSLSNIQNAIDEHKIEFPIVQDNNFVIWKSFKNSWWPHFFLIDKQNIIRFNFVGEGHQKNIKKALIELLSE